MYLRLSAGNLGEIEVRLTIIGKQNIFILFVRFTFKGVDKDPILCGLFPLLENKGGPWERNYAEESNNPKPTRLVIVQLPFSGDVRYPHLDHLLETKAVLQKNTDEAQRSSSALGCDDLIEKTMLASDTLDYKHIPNHKTRSFRKTVIQRVLDKTSDVVATRIDPLSEEDSIDTPFETREQAQPAITALYKSFNLIQRKDSTKL